MSEIKPQKKIAKEKLSENELVSFFPMADLHEFDHYISPKQEKQLKDVYKGYVYFENRDVLLAKITPCFENGKLGIAQNLKNGIGFGSSEYMVFRPKDDITSEYIYYFLSLDNIRKTGKNRMTGAVGHKRIPVEYVSNQLLLIPPLPEQKRIVSILDKVFTEIEKAKSNARQNLKNAKELFDNLLQNLFNNEDWKQRKLGEIAFFKNGMNFTKSSKGQSIEIVGVKNFKNNFWVPFHKLEEVTIDGKLNEAYLLKKGDIIVVRSNGNPKLIGRSLLVDDVTGDISHSGFTIRIRLNSDNITPVFLCHYLKTQRTRDELVHKGNGVGIKSLNQGALSSLTIPIPNSINEQKKIVNKLNQLQTETKKLESLYQKKIADLEELKKSVLQKAFRGEL